MNDCMECWQTILPKTVAHRDRHRPERHLQPLPVEVLRRDVFRLRRRLLFVVSEEPVPGAIRVDVRVAE